MMTVLEQKDRNNTILTVEEYEVVFYRHRLYSSIDLRLNLMHGLKFNFAHIYAQEEPHVLEFLRKLDLSIWFSS